MNTDIELNERAEPAPGATLWLDAGIYHVLVNHPASDLPMVIALHGVTTAEQALAAHSILRCPTPESPARQSFGIETPPRTPSQEPERAAIR